MRNEKYNSAAHGLTSNLTDLNNFQALEAVDRVSDAQLPENWN